MKMSFKKHSILSFSVVFIVIAFIVYGGFAKIDHFFPFQENTVSTDSSPDVATKYPSPKNNNIPSKATIPSTPTSGQTSNQVPVDTTFSASITQLNETNGQVNATATIQHSPTPGTCVFTFSTPNDRPVVDQVTATVKDDVATCGPITISADEFSYLGKWTLSLHYYVGDQQAEAQSTITIQ
jgi:hypothetical protein